MTWGAASFAGERLLQVVLKGKAKKPGFKPGGGMPEVLNIGCFELLAEHQCPCGLD